MIRRFAALTLCALAAAACGPDDLDVAVAENVRGAPIDALAAAAEDAVADAAAADASTPEIDDAADDTAAAVDDPAPESVPVDADGADGTAENGPEVSDDVAVADPIPDTASDSTDDSSTTDVGMIGDVDGGPDGVDIVSTEVPDDDSTAAADALDDEAGEGDDWTAPEPEPPKLIDGIWYVGFDYLGQFDVAISSIPEGSAAAGEHTMKGDEAEEPKELSIETRKLHLETVEIEGYMIPLEFNDEGRVERFFLSRYMMGCCFGIVPKANELIEVTMEDEKGAFYDAYMPIIARGVFSIRDDGGDSKFLRSVFTLNAEETKFSDNW